MPAIMFNGSGESAGLRVQPASSAPHNTGPVKCLTPDCHQMEATAYKRGLCVRCHSSAKKLIEAGRATWENLAEMGLARKQENDDPFTRAFNSKQPQAMEG